MVEQRPIRIGLANQKKDREDAALLINETVERWYHCIPPPPPSVLFVAKDEDRVVGTLGIDLGEEKNPLPIEKIYEFDHTATPWPFDRLKLIQFGKWMASVKGISGVLNYVAVQYAISRGREYGCSEVKEQIAKRLQELGVEVRFIPNAKLLLEKINKEAQGYYLIPPNPKPCMVDLFQMKSALKSSTMLAVSEKRIIFDESVAKELTDAL